MSVYDSALLVNERKQDQEKGLQEMRQSKIFAIVLCIIEC